MFMHIFVYNLKSIFRSKESIFWTLLFPIVLAVLFNFAFGNLATSDDFNMINIAVVENSELKSGTAFHSALGSVSGIDGVSNDDDLFNVTNTTKEEAEKLLKNWDISGYIYYDNEIKLVVRSSGFNETVMKMFLDEYLKTESTVSNILASNPNAINELHSDINSRENFLKQVPISSANPDSTIIYFYSLLAMTCLYSALNGLQEVIKIQANLSAKAARICISPVHKFRVFLYNLSAAAIYQIAVIFIVLGFISVVLGVDFGDKTGYIALTCVIGCITGLFFGTFVGAVVKTGEGVKIAILIGGTLLSCFLSGLMIVNMKYIIQQNAPLISYISPANLITDAFYSLYYYDGLSRYFINIAMLGIITAVFCISTCLVLRRQKYASL